MNNPDDQKLLKAMGDAPSGAAGAYVPETTIAEHFNIATSRGRSALFNKRLDELMKSKDQGGRDLTIDQAVHELRTSQNPDDQKLLKAMGEAPSGAAGAYVTS